MFVKLVIALQSTVSTFHTEIFEHGPVALQSVDNASKGQQQGRWTDHTVERNGSGQGEEEDEGRQDEEHHRKVDHREPPEIQS